MRALPILLLFAALSIPGVTFAGFQGSNTSSGGFQGPTTGIQADTVAKAQNKWDDAPVVLTGNIIQHIAGSDDKYVFRDATGTIIVDIDPEIFAGRTVTPQTTVRLSGKMDKDLMEAAQVDVRILEIL